MSSSMRTRLLPYGVAILSVAVASILMLLLDPMLAMTQTPFLLFFGAVTVSAWYGGSKPGLLATLLSALIANYFFLIPSDKLTLAPINVSRMLLFVLEGIFISFLCGELRTAQQRTKVSLQRLEASEAKFRRLVESNIVGVISASTQGAIVQANDAFLQMVGYTREDLLAGRVRWDEMTPPDLRDLDVPALEELIETGAHPPYEKAYIGKDGRRVPILVGSALLEDESSENVISFIVDLSDRKRTEQRLAVQYAVTRVLAEATSLTEAIPTILQSLCESLGWQMAIIWSLDRQSHLLRYLESWHTPTLNAQEFESSHQGTTFALGEGLPGRIWANGEAAWISDVLEDDNFPRVAIAAKAGLRGALGFPIRVENEILGVIECFSDKIQPPDADLLLMMASIGNQIGQFMERKRTEEELAASQQLFFSFTNNIPGTAFMKDEQGRYLYSNPGGERIVNRKLSEILGKTDFDLVPAEIAQQLRENDLAVLRSGEAIEKLEIVPLGDEEHYWMSFKFPFRDASGRQILAGMSFDVTDRIRTEEALRQSEERYRSLVAATTSVVWTTDAKGAFVSPQPTWEAYTGQSWEQHAGWGWLEMIHPDDRDRVRMLWMEALKARSLYEAEGRFWCAASGEYRYCIARAVPLIEKDGSIREWIGTDIDVDDRERAFSALRENEQRLKLALETGKLGSWQLDLKTGDLECSEICKANFGLPPEADFPYSALLEAIHPDDRASMQSAVQRAIAQGTDYDAEYRIIWPDGSIHWIFARGRCFYAPDGNPLRMIGVTLDITERKRAQEELHRREQEFRALVENSPDVIVRIDRFCRHLYVNPAIEEVTGIQAETFIGKTGAELGYPQEIYQSWKEQIQQIFKTGQECIWEFDFPSPDRLLHNQSRMVPEFAQDGSIKSVLIVTRDVTEYKQLESQLRQQTKELTEANRVKDEFLAVLSHELRSPLNPILGWTQLLRTKNFNAATVDRALETIERNTKVLLQLIEDLLDVSRIMQGKLSLNVNPVNLASVIEAAMETVHLAAQAKSIDLRFSIADGSTGETPVGAREEFLATSSPKFQVLGDYSRLQQVVWNLLSNAVKFTPDGGRVEVRLSLEESGGAEEQRSRGAEEQGSGGAGEQRSIPSHQSPVTYYAQIQIIDTGKGIGADFLPYIFDYFRQESSATTRKFGGLGLGLAIVRRLVEIHGGTVEATSAGEGLGATFTVRLPLSNLELQRNDESVSPGNTPTFEGIKILVVDDEADARELLVFILEQYGAVVQAVSSAEDALRVLENSLPDLLLSDIGMPDMDGYMLMRTIRSLPPEQGGKIKAIAVTAYAGETDHQQVLEAGFQQHIAKPIEPTELANAIAQVIKTKRCRGGVTPPVQDSEF